MTSQEEKDSSQYKLAIQCGSHTMLALDGCMARKQMVQWPGCQSPTQARSRQQRLLLRLIKEAMRQDFRRKWRGKLILKMIAPCSGLRRQNLCLSLQRLKKRWRSVD